MNASIEKRPNLSAKAQKASENADNNRASANHEVLYLAAAKAHERAAEAYEKIGDHVSARDHREVADEHRETAERGKETAEKGKGPGVRHGSDGRFM